MSKFEGPVQEAILALLVTASELRANMDRTLTQHGLTSEQFNILRILRGAQPCGHPCGEIGDRMMDRSPDVTRRIDALEKQGLVERERSHEDRRVVNVKITEKGIAELDSITPFVKDFEKVVVAALTENELTELARICEKLMDAGKLPELDTP